MARYTKTVVDDKSLSNLRMLWHFQIDSSAEPYAESAAGWHEFVRDGSLTAEEASRIVAVQSEIVDL